MVTPAEEQTPAVLPAGVGFSVRLPRGWRPLPLDPDTRRSGLEDLLDEVRRAPELREHRTTIARLLREQTAQAWASGAVYGASMVEPTPDGPITASAVVQVVPGPLGVPAAELLDALAAPLPPVPRSPGGSDDEPWRSTGLVEVATTTGGTVTAVRAVGVEDVDLPDDDGGTVGTVRLVLLQLLVPLPHARTLLLTCTSPVLPLQDVLLELFTAVAETLLLELPAVEVAA